MQMQLKAWRKANKRTQVWVSKQTGIPQNLLSKYERGSNLPQVLNARKIERATGGAVTIDDWYKDGNTFVEAKSLFDRIDR